MSRWTLIRCTFVLSLAGCAGTHMPDFAHPGSAGYQRAVGDYYDPYPLDDVAEPVVGGRPREFQRPVPEVERARQLPPAVPIIQPPVVPPPATMFSPMSSTVPPPPAYPISAPVQTRPVYQVRPPY